MVRVRFQFLLLGALLALAGLAIPSPVVAAEPISGPGWSVGPWTDSEGLRVFSGRSGVALSTQVAVSAGWYIYVRFDRGDVRAIDMRIASAGNHAAAALMCVLLPVDVVKAACEFLSNEYVNSVVAEIRKAKSQNQCFEERWTYPPTPIALVGWRAYDC